MGLNSTDARDSASPYTPSTKNLQKALESREQLDAGLLGIRKSPEKMNGYGMRAGSTPAPPTNGW